MIYAFGNNGSPRIITNIKRVMMPDGSIRMGAPKAAPDADIYEFVKGQQPGLFERIVSSSYDLMGDIITETNVIEFVDLTTIKEKKINEARAAAQAMLSKDDWQTTREAEDPSKPMPVEIRNYRAGVRQASNDFEAQVTAETDPAALQDMQPVWPLDPREPV